MKDVEKCWGVITLNNNQNEKYKHRMDTKKILIVGADGQPIRNADVLIEQTQHEFLFGCAEFSSLPYANNELEGSDKEKADFRFNKFFDLFNYSTLPFYWSYFEESKGKPDTIRLQKTAEWFRANGCTTKGHALSWHSLSPAWLLEMNNTEILTSQLERIKREVSNFAGLVDIWDVINEVVIMPVFDKYDNGITRLCKDLGRIGTVREVFSAAKKSNPEGVFLINDFVCTSIDSYEILIEGCLEAEIPIDAIGIQSHMHQGYWGVEKTLEIVERFSQFNLPIHFTECTLVSGHHMPSDIVDFNDYAIDEWPSTIEGEDRQAREASLHYSTLFAHPNVDSITWWDFVDGQWLGAPVGLITQENRIKPVYEALHNLIKGEWWTGSTRSITDGAGSMNLTGFYGDYNIICNGRKGSFKLQKGNRDNEIIVEVL